MRLLFSAVPAHGHLLPLAPLMEAALAQGHDVAVTTADGMSPVVREELPGRVDHLPAGPMPRTGADPIVLPSAETIGEIFGGARLDATLDAALDAARGWGPGVVVTETYDTVGPMVAAVLGVPWHVVGITTGVPPAWPVAIDRVAAARYAARGLTPVAATSYLDPWPSLLGDPGRDPARGIPVQAVRARPHRRPPGSAPVRIPAFADPSRPTVLVTLGTAVEDDALAAVVDAVAGPDVNVLATLGRSRAEPVPTADGAVRYVPFTPMDRLLDGTSVVVGNGGAGTVLAALSRGVPMVLRPRGACGPVVAERARAAGTAVTVTSTEQVRDAVAAVLADPGCRERAGLAAAQIADAPDPGEVVRRIAARSGPAGRP